MDAPAGGSGRVVPPGIPGRHLDVSLQPVVESRDWEVHSFSLVAASATMKLAEGSSRILSCLSVKRLRDLLPDLVSTAAEIHTLQISSSSSFVVRNPQSKKEVKLDFGLFCLFIRTSNRRLEVELVHKFTC